MVVGLVGVVAVGVVEVDVEVVGTVVGSVGVVAGVVVHLLPTSNFNNKNPDFWYALLSFEIVLNGQLFLWNQIHQFSGKELL